MDGKCLEEGDLDEEKLLNQAPDKFCVRLHRCLSHNRILNYLLPSAVLVVVILVIYFFKDSFKSLLFWAENQNSWYVFFIFIGLFAVVSFPVTVGYLVLIITSGYMFGLIKGLLTVILGANVGVAIAHNTIRSIQTFLPVQKWVFFNIELWPYLSLQNASLWISPDVNGQKKTARLKVLEGLMIRSLHPIFSSKTFSQQFLQYYRNCFSHISTVEWNNKSLGSSWVACV